MCIFRLAPGMVEAQLLFGSLCDWLLRMGSKNWLLL